jgi:ribonuclease P protein component
MLPKKYRLKNGKAFSATYNQRHIVSNRFLILYAGKRKPDASFAAKTGIVVSKKVHKRAVKRNRIKRLIREACRLLIKEDNYNSGYISLVFLPKNDALKADFVTVKKAVSDLLARV